MEEKIYELEKRIEILEKIVLNKSCNCDSNMFIKCSCDKILCGKCDQYNCNVCKCVICDSCKKEIEILHGFYIGRKYCDYCYKRIINVVCGACCNEFDLTTHAKCPGCKKQINIEDYRNEF